MLKETKEKKQQSCAIAGRRRELEKKASGSGSSRGAGAAEPRARPRFTLHPDLVGMARAAQRGLICRQTPRPNPRGGKPQCLSPAGAETPGPGAERTRHERRRLQGRAMPSDRQREPRAAYYSVAHPCSAVTSAGSEITLHFI
ncbi:hypothetical protein NN561_011002 [Cricetulus griseus]